MNKKPEKPTPEAKALSLFLMAHRSIDPAFKEQLKRINRQWDLVMHKKISRSDYAKEVQTLLDTHGGYSEVIEKTVRYYLDKSGTWNLKGDDKYCLDAKAIVEKIQKK